MLILIVAVLVMLYAVGVGVGQKEGGLPSRADIEGWADRFTSDPVPIGSGDVRWAGGGSQPWNTRRIPAKGKATLHIVASSKDQRELVIETQHPLRIELIRRSSPDVPITMSTKADRDNELSQRVDDEGAEVRLTCQRDDDPCVVRVR
ncbi:hypothetical protein [Haliangium sp.]|uniref:hypothetical protein n=1 Tax=Haliangium sp. TaxID=2663208 RepID=UPI003D11C673